jgi:hypothetical protein
MLKWEDNVKMDPKKFDISVRTEFTIVTGGGFFGHSNGPPIF